MLAAVGGSAYLWFAPLIISYRGSRSSAWAVGDEFALIYGGVGLFFGILGLAGALLSGRFGYGLLWVSALGLGGVAFLAFLATFGEPRISAVFIPAAGLLLAAAGSRPSVNEPRPPDSRGSSVEAPPGLFDGTVPPSGGTLG